MRSKLTSSRWKLMFISSIFLILNTVVFGVPLSMSYPNEDIITEHFAQEKERDDKKLYESNCIVNGSKYVEGDNVPGAGPCEECICHPPNVVCSMMKCPINSGCITIQLPNKCCPKYKCDCEHKGKLYNNGEKINKSDESACKVCFCNGGEIVCTSIVCYTRKDCQGYYLPGDCCPKFDNCSSTSTSIEQKSRNIHYYSTEQNYNEDSIWKRDTEKSLNQELSTIPNIITMPSIFFDSEENVTRQINTLVPSNFEELNGSTSNSTSENTITYEPDNVVTEISLGDLIIEDSSTSFLGFKTDNLTTVYDKTTDSSLTINNNETSEMAPQFEELFDTIDIDNSVVIAHQNGTETVIGITEASAIEENINSSTETTTSTQVEIFDPSDLMLDTKRPITEFSTITSELDGTTEMDYDGSREATTPRAPDKSTIGIPHKLIVDDLQTTIEDEINTEKTFTDLEDTTDMFGPNFGHRSYKTQTNHILINSDTTDLKVKENNVTTFLPNTKNIKEIITKSSQIELFDQPLINLDKKNVDNSTSVNIKLNQENILVQAPQVYNNTNFIELETTNITTCVNKSCSDYTELNDELLDSQIESTTTTPFIIETKVLPNEASPLFKKIKYPKEYPDEFETIQNGPSLTITKRTYTSIPDIVYTTTTMVTLPTLDLIYKADKEIEKYFSEMQSTTIKSKNSYLSPLRNVSSLNST